MPTLSSNSSSGISTETSKFPATLAAHILGIKSSTTRENLMEYLAKQDLGLSEDHGSIVFTKCNDDGKKRTTVAFDSEETFNRAMSLKRGQRRLDDVVLEFDHKFLGFTVFSDGSDVDIIALHGVNGHAFTSFEYREENYSFMWLKDTLPMSMPEARVMVYGYDANVASDVSVGRIRTFAETFMQKLRFIRKDANRPLILVGHALGGLIIKQALILPNAEGLLDSIIDSVRGVIFMATPHQGINGVDNSTFVKNFFGASGTTIGHELIAEHDARTMVLFDLTTDFKEFIAKKNITVRTFYETQKTKVGDMEPVLIVDEQSSKLGVAGEQSRGFDADHINICKFTSPDEETLKEFVEITKELTQLIQTPTAPPPTTLEQSNASESIGASMEQCIELPHSNRIGSSDATGSYEVDSRLPSTEKTNIKRVVGHFMEPNSSGQTTSGTFTRIENPVIGHKGNQDKKLEGLLLPAVPNSFARQQFTCQ